MSILIAIGVSAVLFYLVGRLRDRVDALEERLTTLETRFNNTELDI